MLKPTLITALWLLFFCANAQLPTTISGIINIYTPVLQFDCDSSLLTVGSASGFGTGDKVLLIQMQGATVDSSNTSNFGTVVAPGNAGNYEFNRVASITGNSVQLKYRLSKPYDVAGKVQLICVPEYVDVTAYGLSCKPWDGSTGGVLAIDVKNQLVLKGNVDVSGKGFRGGLWENNSVQGHKTDYFYPPNASWSGAKGEGIAMMPVDKSSGRGKAANGGGGGNAINAGGGGGSNAGAGGNGGLAYFNTPGGPTANTDGQGGQAIYQNNTDHIIMGGGGGAGQANDNKGSNGGVGGGIIFLTAQKIASNNFDLLANGEDIFGPGGDTANDGQGGGGAGGTIVLSTETVNGQLNCAATGGRGGNCLFYVYSQIIGPGGGGGGGKVLSPNLPGISFNVQPGISGMANQNTTNGALDGNAGLNITSFSLVVDTNTIEVGAIELSLNDPSCAATNTGSITVVNTQGILFSLNNGTFQPSPVFTGLSAGQYLISVKKNDCYTQDTLITLNLQPSFYTTLNSVTLCPSDTVYINGIGYMQPGIVIDTLPGINGCDTIATYTITAGTNPTVTKTLSLNPGETVVIDGLAYTAPDTVFSISQGSPCDTFVTWYLKLKTESITGIVNIYTPVLQFSCDSSLLTVGNTSGFSTGDTVLLIQMQGATVDLSNTNNFGTVLDPGNAGNYEFNRVASTAGNTVQLKYALSKPYDIAGKVQLIRVPQYIDVTATNLTCKPWDGSTGGVLVMNVVNKLILNGNVDVSSKGFRGGLLDNGSNISSHETQYYYPPNPKLAAAKGEGVAGIPPDKSYGRGRVASGGGGGNAHNAGGGGGAHIGAGGKGGLEYFNTPGNPTAGTDGQGGQEIYPDNANRLLMGGGGGAGQANDNQGSSGGNGGGIIFLNALKIESNNFNLLAKGEDVFGPGGDLVNDGQGGGGAGGTIILNTGKVTGSLACIASGGRGGDCLFYVNTQIIGPGGGGGGGRVAGLSNLLTYATVDVSPGQPGIANQNNHNGASAGQAGKVFTNFVTTEDFATAFSLRPINIKVDVPYCDKSGKIEVLNETGALYNINNGQQQLSPVFNDIYAGTYTIQAWKNGCHKDTTIILEESPYSIGYSDLLLCRGETVTIHGVVYNSAATVVDTIVAPSGCDSLHVTNITLDDGPETFLGADSLICPGATIVLSSPYPETYWNGSILGTIFEVTTPGTVFAKAKNEQGCWINDTVQILQCCSLKTIYVPNVFTPGSTDENSQFCIFPSPSCSELLLRVYDRWGSLVFESRQADNCWDGSWRGKEAASGVYVWVLEFFSHESRQHSVIRGDVTLLR